MHNEYKLKGKLFKAEFKMAKQALLDGMDEIREDVDEVAAGSENIILEGGFKPRKAVRSKKNKPHAPVFEYIRHGATREILTACKKVTDAASYTCILCEGVSAKGLIRVEGDLVIIPKDLANVYISESQNRRKKFPNLVQLQTYYAYYFARNSAGISALSEERSIICV
jgi:hypothetical protein